MSPLVVAVVLIAAGNVTIMENNSLVTGRRANDQKTHRHTPAVADDFASVVNELLFELLRQLVIVSFRRIALIDVVLHEYEHIWIMRAMHRTVMTQFHD